MKRLHLGWVVVGLMAGCGSSSHVPGGADDGENDDVVEETGDAARAGGGAPMLQVVGTPGTRLPGGPPGAPTGTAGAGPAVVGGEPAAPDLSSVPDSPTYYTDVKPIVDAKCGQCHFSGGIGPMPLTTYDEVEIFAGLIKGAVQSRTMPPWIAVGPLHEFVGDRRLTEAQIETIVRWVEQGAAEGDPALEGPSIGEVPRKLDRVDVSLQIPEAYTPQINPDDYRCFVIEWPYQETKYITGTSFEPGNLEIVHHAIVYHVQPERAQASRDRDASEAGPGYTCFGGSGGSAAWLMSWEPGGYGQALPGGLGYEVRPGSVMILQIHYNTLSRTGTDESRIDLMLEDSVERVGKVTLFMNPTWIAGAMPIPANQPDVTHIYQGRPSSAGSSAQRIHWVDLHMHALGSWGRIGIWRADGTYESLLEIPAWDFAWQETYIYNEPRTLNPGDRMHLECHFDNTAQNQIVINGQQLAPRDVNWGDGTTDEMCLGNILISPL